MTRVTTDRSAGRSTRHAGWAWTTAITGALSVLLSLWWLADGDAWMRGVVAVIGSRLGPWVAVLVWTGSTVAAAVGALVLGAAALRERRFPLPRAVAAAALALAPTAVLCAILALQDIDRSMRG